MTDNRLLIAAQNNALWCAAVLRAQDQESLFADGFWHCLGPGLPFYPTIVTLASTASPTLIEALAALPAGASVKDSFGTLNLSDQGFLKLFDARWLWRPATNQDQTTAGQLIHRPTDLAAWCRAWQDDGPEVFSADLLQDPDISFLAVPNGAAITGGVIVNRGPEGVAGISNLFGADSGKDALMTAVSRFGDHELIGYESDQDQIDKYVSLGFEKLSPLAIYLKE